MLAPARMPVAEGKKMENMPKKLLSGPCHLGTKFSTKISAVERTLSVYCTADSETLMIGYPCTVYKQPCTTYFTPTTILKQ